MKKNQLIHCLIFLSFMISSCQKNNGNTKEDVDINWESPTDNQVYHYGDTIHVKGTYFIRQMGDWAGTDPLWLNLSTGESKILGYDGEEGTFDVEYYNLYTDTTIIEMIISLNGAYGVEDVELKRKILCLPN